MKQPAKDTPSRLRVDRDERERHGWFQRMPEDAREEIRDAWHEEEQSDERMRRFCAEHRKLTVIGGALVFLVTETIFAPFSLGFLRTLCAPLVGAGVGWLWDRVAAGQARCQLIGLPFHMLFRIVFGLGSGIPAFLQACFGFLAFMGLSGLVGTRRQFREHGA